MFSPEFSGHASGQVTQNQDDDALLRRISWRIVPLLFVCYLVAQIDRMNISFAKLTMMADLGFSDYIYGLGAGIFFIGYVLVEVPSNLALKRYGAPFWLGRIMVTWGILTASMIFVHSVISFYVLRFTLGMAEAGFFPGVIFYFTLWFPVSRRARVTAIFMTAIALSGVVVGPISGLVLESMDRVASLSGWQWLFVFEGLPAIFLGIWCMMSLDRSPRDAHWLSSTECDRVEALIEADRPIESAGSNTHRFSLWRIILDVRVLLLSLVYGCYGASFFGFVFWLPTIIQHAGVKNSLNIGLLSMIPWLCGAGLMLSISARADRLRDVRPLLIALALMAGVGWLCSPFALVNLVGAIAMCSVAMAGTMASLPIFWRLPASLFRGTAAATAIAVITALGNFPGFASPFVVGWIKASTGSFTISMYLFGATMLLASLTLLFLKSEQARPLSTL